jgi:flagellar basal-body rod protein FlgF
MQPGLYVSLSAQLALHRRMETIAHNVANAGTAGFRADEVSFEALISRSADQTVAFASAGETFLSRRGGAMTKTDNPLDVAVQGEGWLAVQTPQGTAYTRDGRLRMNAAGMLQTLAGRPVLDAGGAPITLDPNAGPPRISSDGMISQNGQQVGAIGLFAIDERAKLARVEGTAVVPDRPAAAILEFTGNGIAQGFVEESNVNPVMEMSKLIMVSRAFESITAAMQTSETSLQDAIKTLGGTT